MHEELRRLTEERAGLAMAMAEARAEFRVTAAEFESDVTVNLSNGVLNATWILVVAWAVLLVLGLFVTNLT